MELQLFGCAGVATGQRRRAEPDWPELARELKRPGVTMTILWEEYREVHPEGYGYSRFADLLRGFERRITPVMRQHHVAGEKAFVEYSGKRIGIADPTTGEIREAEIFVGVLGAAAGSIPTMQGEIFAANAINVSRLARRRKTTAPEVSRPTTLQTFLPRSTPRTEILIALSSL